MDRNGIIREILNGFAGPIRGRTGGRADELRLIETDDEARAMP